MPSCLQTQFLHSCARDSSEYSWEAFGVFPNLMVHTIQYKFLASDNLKKRFNVYSEIFINVFVF